MVPSSTILIPKHVLFMITTETLKISLQLRGINNFDVPDYLINQNLHSLHLIIPISSAQVLLEHQPATAPSFRVVAHLAVAGPDFHASARDHTLLAAWRKVAKRLKQQYQGRITQRQLRLKGGGGCRTVTSQWNRGT
jgi:hypothetical protein